MRYSGIALALICPPSCQLRYENRLTRNFLVSYRQNLKLFAKKYRSFQEELRNCLMFSFWKYQDIWIKSSTYPVIFHSFMAYCTIFTLFLDISSRGDGLLTQTIVGETSRVGWRWLAHLHGVGIHDLLLQNLLRSYHAATGWRVSSDVGLHRRFSIASQVRS